MEPRDLALLNARGRMAIGATLLVAPRLIGPMWVGDEGGRPAVKLLARAIGVRDLVMGLGTAIALDRGAPVRGWLEGAAVADTVDFVATLATGDSIPPRARRGVLLVAAVSAVSCALLSRALETPPAEHEVFVTEAHLSGHP